MPPLLAGGAVLAGIVRAVAGRAAFRMGAAQLGTAALTGLLVAAWGNGFVVIAQQQVASGPAALRLAAMLRWIVLWRAVTGDRPRAATVVGVAVGAVGLGALVPATPGSGVVTGRAWWGPWLVLLAGLGWATGTFLTTRLQVPANPFAPAAVQMLVGGVIMIGVGTGLGERLHPAAVTTVSWWAWAFSAYAYALSTLPVSTVSTYAYVNPVVAVQLAGGAIVLVAVVLVLAAERPARRCQGSVAASTP